MGRFRGGCLCGRVEFEIDAELSSVIDCNCSICTKKGFLHLFVPKDRFHLLQPFAPVVSVTFSVDYAEHFYCRSCGIHAYHVPRSLPDFVDVNVRCLESVDIRSLQVILVDAHGWDHSMDIPPANPTPRASA